MKIGVVGAGHAGVEAARTAAEGAQVLLFSAEEALPYYRPKLVAFAMGQLEERDLEMHPAEWYRQQGIQLLRATAAQTIEVESKSVVSRLGRASFDALILATGAVPLWPAFLRETSPGADFVATPLWTLAHARVIREKIATGRRLVVVGGGILGVEVALRAVDRGLKVCIVERESRLMASQLGIAAAEVLARHLQERGIELLFARAVRGLRSAGGQIEVELESGGARRGDLLIVAAGRTRDLRLANRAGLKTERGVVVGTGLETSAQGIFACGDIAQGPGPDRSSAVEAARQGRHAAMNAVAWVRGEALKPYEPSRGALHFGYQSCQIHAVGEPGRDGDEVTVLEQTATTCRVLIRRAGQLVGVQMVGSSRDFDAWAEKVQVPNEKRSAI